MTKINLEKLSLEELKELEKDVSKAIKSFEQRRKKEALAAVEAAAREFGFSLSELNGLKTKPAKATAVKYRHPENPSLTWSGRGRKPVWFKEAVESGKTEEELLIA